MRSTDNQKWTVADFKSLCYNKGPTLILARAKDTGRRCGGFTEADWDDSGTYKTDATAFLFSLNSDQIYPVVDSAKAIYCDSNGPRFGENSSLWFFQTFNGGHNDSYPNDKCKTYNVPKIAGSDNSELTGKRADFAVDEFECY